MGVLNVFDILRSSANRCDGLLFHLQRQYMLVLMSRSAMRLIARTCTVFHATHNLVVRAATSPWRKLPFSCYQP